MDKKLVIGAVAAVVVLAAVFLLMQPKGETAQPAGGGTPAKICQMTVSTSSEAPDHKHEWCEGDEYTSEVNGHRHKINITANLAEAAGVGPHTHQLRLLVGGDRDEHGCIGSAGYQWCDAKQKCVRDWEEPCGTDECVGMNVSEAREIAGGAPCNGSITIDRWCNNVTKTFWFGMAIKKTGCSPACMIYVENKTAEINWMCTGLIMP